jgi:hypothetical protein
LLKVQQNVHETNPTSFIDVTHSRTERSFFPEKPGHISDDDNTTQSSSTDTKVVKNKLDLRLQKKPNSRKTLRNPSTTPRKEVWDNKPSTTLTTNPPPVTPKNDDNVGPESKNNVESENEDDEDVDPESTPEQNESRYL